MLECLKLERKDNVKAVWITVVVCVPLIGAIVFWLFAPWTRPPDIEGK